MRDFLKAYSNLVDNIDTVSILGKIKRVRGLLIESLGPHCGIGDLCYIKLENRKKVYAEVVGVNQNFLQLMPYENFDKIKVGDLVYKLNKKLLIPLSNSLLGRVVDYLGRPLDSKGSIDERDNSIFNEDLIKKISPIERGLFQEQAYTGIKAIDILLPIAKGQRLGIFSGAGVGKSTLLGMLAKNSKAEINVIALIGERGRELNEFIEYDLGEEGLKKSVLIVSTSDDSPVARYKGAYTATHIAEYFREQGRDVLLLFDSITRFANAKREIGLSLGEPPATKGYPPSVFAELPMILERAGIKGKGKITAFYTVLVEGDDINEPISDNAKAFLDGHIILERALADKAVYPAINVLSSSSRSIHRILDSKRQKLINKAKSFLSLYKEYEELINTGIYQKGSNEEIDRAIEKYHKIMDFIVQDIDDKFDFNELLLEFENILN